MCLLWILYLYTVPRGGTGVVSLLWFYLYLINHFTEIPFTNKTQLSCLNRKERLWKCCVLHAFRTPLSVFTEIWTLQYSYFCRDRNFIME
jgi:hypothetical protein